MSFFPRKMFVVNPAKSRVQFDHSRAASSNGPGDFRTDARQAQDRSWAALKRGSMLVRTLGQPPPVLVFPTASVRSETKQQRPNMTVFPQEITSGVWRCGFNARASFGAHSYFVARPGGNLLIDSPGQRRIPTR